MIIALFRIPHLTYLVIFIFCQNLIELFFYDICVKMFIEFAVFEEEDAYSFKVNASELVWITQKLNENVLIKIVFECNCLL